MVKSLALDLALEPMEKRATPPRKAKAAVGKYPTLSTQPKAKKNSTVVCKIKSMQQKANKKTAHKRFATKTPKKRACRRRRRADVVAMKEIRKYQASTNLLIPKERVYRVVREIEEDHVWYMRKNPAVRPIYQEAAEGHVVDLMNVTNHIAEHSNRTTIMKRDVELALRIRNK